MRKLNKIFKGPLLLVAMSISVLSSSCVKESRTVCPSLVRFDIGNMAIPEGMKEGVVDLYVYSSSGELVMNEMRRWREDLVVDKNLAKDNYTVAAYFSKDGIFPYVIQDRINIDWGTQGFELYGGSRTVDVQQDYVYVRPKVTKQYSKVTIYNMGSEETGETISFSGLTAYIDSPYGGYALASCKAVHNDLHFLVNPEGDEFDFLLPRQTNQGDRNLILILRSKSLMLATLELWRYMEAAGYPWDAEDLPDIRIGVNFKNATVHVKVVGWGEEIVTSLM